MVGHTCIVQGLILPNGGYGYECSYEKDVKDEKSSLLDVVKGYALRCLIKCLKS